jgi:putative phosphoesterase
VTILRRADLIVHTGDFTALHVLEELRALAPVAAVYGNVDEWPLRHALPERATVEHEGLRLGIVHDPGPCTGRHARLRSWFPAADLIAYGHTHAPELVEHDGAWIVNPGSPTERRRARGHTMVVLRGGVPELVAV